MFSVIQCLSKARNQTSIASRRLRKLERLLTRTVPRHQTIWQWLFESPASPIISSPNQAAGFNDAHTKARISWHQLKSNSTYLSTALSRHFGLIPGETVALFSQNTIWYPVAMHAVTRLGGIVSGASPAYNVEEMTYALKTCRANFLMTMPNNMEVANKAAQAANIPKERVFMLEGELAGYKNLLDLIDIGRLYDETEQMPSFRMPTTMTNKELCAFLSFSSGTTGLPKAVMISHQNVIAQCLQIQQITPDTHKKVLAVLPSFHITGLVHILHLPILLNAEVYMIPTFSMKSMLDVIVDYQIGELLLVPPILIRMVRDPIVDEYDLKHITRFSSGAAPLSDEIIQQLKKRFPNTGFKQGYGMTESCSCITAHPPDRFGYEHAHKVGTICASTEIKIVDESGNELGIGEPGEILARGPQITMGYLNNETANRNTYEDGWLRTGDQAMIDSEGMVTITDRIKEMIKVRGIGVAPAELEDLLLGHKHVEDVAILGIMDEYSGEKPKAFVVRKVDAPTDDIFRQMLFEYVKERKVRYKWLKEVEFVSEIPKSASGKILRRVLRDRDHRSEKSVTAKNNGVPRAKL